MMMYAEMEAEVEYAIHQLDLAMGKRRAGMAVSGAWAPSYKGFVNGEDPIYATSRILVAPMIVRLGYANVTAGEIAEGRVPGLVICIVSMNRSLSRATGDVIGRMRVGSPDHGIATDGFTWARVAMTQRGPRVVCVVDLRPRYVEALDRDRFRVAVPSDPGIIREFADSFAKDAVIRGCYDL